MLYISSNTTRNLLWIVCKGWSCLHLEPEKRSQGLRKSPSHIKNKKIEPPFINNFRDFDFASEKITDSFSKFLAKPFRLSGNPQKSHTVMISFFFPGKKSESLYIGINCRDSSNNFTS